MSLKQVFEHKKCVFSFEVFPPKKTGNLDKIYSTLEQLKDLSPDFISVTYGAGGTAAQKDLTVQLATDIQKMGVQSIAHLTCLHASKADIFDTLDKLEHNGVENVLLLRGDRIEGSEEGTYKHAGELIAEVSERGGFHIAAACYPEGHTEAASLVEDVRFLKRKVDAGAQQLISQLFFDNNSFLRFMEMTQVAGINVPIQAGIMPIVNKRQIERVVTLSGAGMPPAFTRMLARFESDPAALRDAGISYATQQIIDLIGAGVRGIHLYTMNNAAVAKEIYSNVASALGYVNSEGK